MTSLGPTFLHPAMADDELRYKKAVCGRIKRARRRAGLTQQEMADVLGVKLRTYQNYECDRIPWDHLDAIAGELGVTKDWIITGSEVNERPLREKLDLIEGELLELRRLLEDRQDENGNGAGAA